MSNDASESFAGYKYSDSEFNPANLYLLPPVTKELEHLCTDATKRRVFELGCGNGAIANALSKLGFQVVGIDASDEGIAFARRSFPEISLHQRSAYDDLSGEFGTFPLVLSLEVVEHLFFPRKYAANVFNLLEPGGTALISTPYHGYIKNLAIALSGKMDAHFSALWDYGHIKFWSVKTLTALLREAGLVDIEFRFVGRIPVLAKSMIAIAKRPAR